MKKFINSFGKFFSYLDIYGQKVDLYMDSRSKVRSKFGACVSCLVFIVCIITFFNGINDWFNEVNLQTISSWKNYNIHDLLKANQSYSYDIDYKNFNIYFVLYYNVGKGKNMLFQSLERYFIQKLRYSDKETIIRDIELEPCVKKNLNIFLLDSYNESDISRTNTAVCIKSDTKLSLDLLADVQNGRIITTFLEYSVEKCQNSTANNFSCASEQEIMEMLPGIYIQISLPKSYYDFKDIKNPRKRTYDFQFFKLDANSIKSFEQKFLPIYLYTDKGIINDDYKLDSIDLIPNERLSNSFARDLNDNRFLVFGLYLQFDKEIFYRQNDKLQKLVANFGGLINIFFIIGKLFSTTFNYLKLKHKLINSSFENFEETSDKKIIK